APLLHEGTAVAFAVNGVYWFYGEGFAPLGMTPDTSRLDPGGALHRLVGAPRPLGVGVHRPNPITSPCPVAPPPPPSTPPSPAHLRRRRGPAAGGSRAPPSAGCTPARLPVPRGPPPRHPPRHVEQAGPQRRPLADLLPDPIAGGGRLWRSRLAAAGDGADAG